MLGVIYILRNRDDWKKIGISCSCLYWTEERIVYPMKGFSGWQPFISTDLFFKEKNNHQKLWLSFYSNVTFLDLFSITEWSHLAFDTTHEVLGKGGADFFWYFYILFLRSLFVLQLRCFTTSSLLTQKQYYYPCTRLSSIAHSGRMPNCQNNNLPWDR